jgi:hypothetical protein
MACARTQEITKSLLSLRIRQGWNNIISLGHGGGGYTRRTRTLTSPHTRNRNYSAARILWQSNNSNSKSYLDGLHTGASQWWKKTVQLTNSTAKEAASKTLETTQTLTKQAAEQAVKTASETIKKHKLDETLRQTSRQWQETAANTSRAVGTAAQQALHEGSQSAKQATKQAITATSGSVRETSKKWADSLTITGTKALKWFAVWSLAAVFVYGMATTLPIALIKYSVERRNQQKIKDYELTNDDRSSSQVQNRGEAASTFTNWGTWTTMLGFAKEENDKQSNSENPSSKSIFRWWA